jgi:hypothetical protein
MQAQRGAEQLLLAEVWMLGAVLLQLVLTPACACGLCALFVPLQNPNLQRPPPPPTQSVEEIQRLVQMARSVGPVQPSVVDAGQ